MKSPAALLLFVPSVLIGQQHEPPPLSERQHERPPQAGMLMDPGGGWVAPTPEEAMSALMHESDLTGGGYAADPALAVLRRVYEPFSDAELEAFTDALAEIMLPEVEVSDPLSMIQTETFAMIGEAVARDRSDGEPYPGAMRALTHVYEVRAAKALAQGGTDPIFEIRKDGGPSSRAVHLEMALWHIYNADPEGLGRAYISDVFARSRPPDEVCIEGAVILRPGMKPPPACPTPALWCYTAALFMVDRRGEVKRPRDIEGAPDPETFERLCMGRVKEASSGS